MKDKKLVQEIQEKIRQLDYAGTSLNNGVYPLFDGEEVKGIFYPEKNCVLIYPEEIIKDVYTYDEAMKLIGK